jgi:hypothetical protein
MHIRVLDVVGLGYEAVQITIDGEQVLLLDADIDTDTRIDMLNEVLTQLPTG